MSGRPDVELALRQALAYLWRADISWRNADPSAPGPLHWPIAVREAKRALSTALEALGAVQAPEPEREPEERCPEDAQAGMAWFNRLTPTQRSWWLRVAESGRPADAWRAFQNWETRP